MEYTYWLPKRGRVRKEKLIFIKLGEEFIETHEQVSKGFEVRGDISYNLEAFLDLTQTSFRLLKSRRLTYKYYKLYTALNKGYNIRISRNEGVNDRKELLD